MDEATPAEADRDSPVEPQRSRQPLWLAIGAATLVALLSAGVAVYAIAQANMAHDLARDAYASAGDPQALANTDAPDPEDSEDPEAPLPTEPDDGGGTSTAEPSPESDGTDQPDALSPRAEYSLSYENQSITPIATSSETCIDIDRHQVVIDQDCNNDLRLSSSCDVPCFQEVRGIAAQADTADLGPEDCADRISRRPLPSNEPIPAQRGTVLCIVTSRSDADDEGIPQRIAVLEVTGRDENEVSVRMTAWEVPT